MYKEFFRDSAFLDFPLFTLLLFISVFAYVVIRAFSRKRESHIEALARMPLEDGAPAGEALRGNPLR